MGAGQWSGNVFVPAATLGSPYALDFVLTERHRLPWQEITLLLLEYFERQETGLVPLQRRGAEQFERFVSEDDRAEDQPCIAARSLAEEVNSVLSPYIVIHDEIFALSLRKLFPIPILFKPIEYCKHKESLAILEEALQHSRHRVSRTAPDAASAAEACFLAALEDYSAALLESIGRLQQMSVSLCLKSEDGRYSMQQYRQNSAAYAESVRRYRSLGTRLNQLFKDLE